MLELIKLSALDWMADCGSQSVDPTLLSLHAAFLTKGQSYTHTLAPKNHTFQVLLNKKKLVLVSLSVMLWIELQGLLDGKISRLEQGNRRVSSQEQYRSQGD